MIKKAIVLFISALLSSCSFESLIISNLDFILTNQISKNLNLNYQDKKSLKKEVRGFLNNNKEQAKVLKRHLEKVDIQAIKVKGEMEFFWKFYHDIAKELNPIISKRISNFDNNKYKKFDQELKEKNNEILTKNKEKKVESYFKRYEFFFGELDKKQKNMIIDISPLLKKLSEQRQAKRLRTQEEMNKIRKIDDPLKRTAALIELFNKVTDRTNLNENQVKLAESIQKLVKTLSKKQIDFFNAKKIKYSDWIDKFIETTY